MYGWYAPDPRMRANVGIRRRLAPLLDNSPRRDRADPRAAAVAARVSPCLYYGDEIGMGDNIWLDDRDAVAHADAVDAGPQRRLLHRRPGQALPAGRVQSLVYHYNNINVEAQMATQLLAAALDARRCSQIRRRHPVFGLGDFEVVPGRQRRRPGVPARARRRTSTTATSRRDGAVRQQPVAAARRPAPIRLPDQFAGARTRDLFGGSGFPAVTDDGAADPDLGLAGLLLAPAARRGERRG